MGIASRLSHAWNAFVSGEQETAPKPVFDLGGSYGYRTDRVRLRISNERSIITSIYNRIGVDVASVDIRHVRLDEESRYIGDKGS